jgi:hypothetical protein
MEPLQVSSRPIYSRGIAQKSAVPVLQPRTPMELFDKALQEYEAAAGSKQQAWLIEPVIRTSRGVAESTVPLSADEVATLSSIQERYRAFGDGRNWPLRTYADAATMLRALFF